MTWFRDVAMLFGEWLLIMLIALIIGIVIGWLLWYRRWRKVEAEKATITKELNGCRSEKEAIARSRSEEIETHKLNLENNRKKADDKLAAKSAERDKWEADYKECLRDNEALDLGYKEDIAKLKGRIAELVGEQEGNANRALEFDALNTELVALKASNEEAKVQSGTIEKLNLELNASKKENQRLAEALVNAEKVQGSLDSCERRVAELQSELDAAPSTVSNLEADEVADPKESDDNAFTKHLEEVSKGINLDYEDDLKKISGVGPKMEKMLKDFGVQTFYQLSKFDDDGVEALNAKLDGFPGRIQRDNWVGQALELHDKYHK